MWHLGGGQLAGIWNFFFNCNNCTNKNYMRVVIPYSINTSVIF